MTSKSSISLDAYLYTTVLCETQCACACSLSTSC